LTTKEYTLLEYLARLKGRVVSRADISAHVWDDNHDPLSNAIEVYINRLRKKIGAVDARRSSRRAAGGLPSDRSRYRRDHRRALPAR